MSVMSLRLLLLASNLAATATWPCSQACNGEMYKVTWEAGGGRGEERERGTGKEIGRTASNLAATATWPCSQACNGEVYKVTWEAGRERERERRGRGRGGQARR